MQDRASGILIHISSLPGKYGIGDLGPQAYQFADRLAAAGQTYWQVLPLNPPTGGLCPYHCLSAFAGNPLLISPELLYRDDLLMKRELSDRPKFPRTKVDEHLVCSYKSRLFEAAYERFRTKPPRATYRAFCRDNKDWLDDYVLFTSLREHFAGKFWCDWPVGLRDRKPGDLADARRELAEAIGKHEFLQYVLHRQWLSFKGYCSKRNIRIIGDIPIYVAHDSSDLWANPEIFKLNRARKPKFVGGVPPDYFSRKGQLWGSPVYDWTELKRQHYSWWIRRIQHNLGLFDVVRLDHFCAFVKYWEIRAGSRTAKKGRWVPAAGEGFFERLFKNVEKSSLVVEDLGHVADEARDLMRKYDLCGMRVLQFAFDDNRENLHIPFNLQRNCIIYTGTHDNNTTKGWFADEARAEQKKRLRDYLGRHVAATNIHAEFVRLAAGSVARLTIIPLQDVLGLGSSARMNVPGTADGNWSWRLREGQFTDATVKELAKVTRIYGREAR